MPDENDRKIERPTPNRENFSVPPTPKEDPPVNPFQKPDTFQKGADMPPSRKDDGQ